MNKIVKSLSVIAFVAAIAIGATSAYFSDEEKSTGNTFTAGTIDIAIDGNNPWTQNGYNMGDLKPGETGYINFDITNVGANPVNVSKNLWNFVGTGGNEQYPCASLTTGNGYTSSEPECVAEQLNSNTRKDDVQTQIIYDLSVKVYSSAGEANLIWWQDIYTDAEGKTLSQIYTSGNSYVTLGMIPVGGHMKVTQSYHFKTEAGNEYQGDNLKFDITIKGEQLPQGPNGMASVVLENKGGAPNWDILQFDNVVGTLNYQTSGTTFNYNFSAVVNTANINYTLLYVGPSGNFPYSGEKIIGSGTASGTTLSFSGSPELSGSIINGKVWLIPTSTYSAGWDHVNNLYETGLVNYTDTGI